MSRFVVRRFLQALVVLFFAVDFHVSYLPGHTERESCPAFGWADGDPGDDRRDHQGLGLRQADLRAVPRHDAEDLHRQCRFLQPTGQCPEPNPAGVARDGVAGDRGEHHLASLGHRLRASERVATQGDRGPWPGGVLADRDLHAGVRGGLRAPLRTRVPDQRVPERWLRALYSVRVAVVHSHGAAVVHALIAGGGLLLAGLPVESSRDRASGVCPYGKGEGPRVAGWSWGTLCAIPSSRSFPCGAWTSPE